MDENWLSEGTKKAIPGMERPLTIACHMKIFVLGLNHYPASWDILSSRKPSVTNYFLVVSTAGALVVSTGTTTVVSTTVVSTGTTTVVSVASVFSPSLLQATKPRIANANKTFFILSKF
jgi:hypothetical protein